MHHLHFHTAHSSVLRGIQARWRSVVLVPASEILWQARPQVCFPFQPRTSLKKYIINFLNILIK